MQKQKELDKDVQKALKDILSACKQEDRDIRKDQIRTWKKAEEFWHGVQHLFWSDRDESWISPSDANWKAGFTDAEMEDVGPFYDFVINYYRAHGEAIIAALAAQLPSLRFIPDDADDDNDVLTARTFSKVAELVQRHNKAKLIFFRSLFFLWNTGLVASYIYKDSDWKYGYHEIPVYDSESRTKLSQTCPECDYEFPPSQPDEEAPLSNDTQPSDVTPQQMCPNCQEEVTPKSVKSVESVPIQSGTKKLPKSRVKIVVYGPLFFKVNYFATTQDDVDYILLFLDQAKSTVKEAYQHIDGMEEKIEMEQIESMDRFSRSAYSYPYASDPESKNLVTVTKAWFRPSRYFTISDKDVREKLQEMFPDGVKATFIGKTDVFVEAEAELLDDRWKIGKAGLSTYIHSDAVGKPLISINEMRNQLTNVAMDTIDHGNPETYADPKVLDFDAYGSRESRPGYVYPAKPRTPSATLAQSFYQPTRTSLSREVPIVQKQLDQDGQFVVGSFPSIYGGPSEGKSRTFSEYAASRQMALQRLMILWAFVVDWWGNTIDGAVRMFIEMMSDNEHYSVFNEGQYINVWIRRAEATGQVGGVESEASETFPVSLSQKKDLLMKLIELNNPFINSALFTPQNSRIIQDVMAMNEFKLPAEAQRIKQVLEIDELSKGEPIEGGMQPDGQPQMTPTVLPDIDVDDHEIHIITLKAYLVDQSGLDLRRTNPAGYMNCISHLRAHVAMAQMQAMQQAPAQPQPQQGRPAKPQGAPQ